MSNGRVWPLVFAFAVAIVLLGTQAVSADNGPPKPPWTDPKNYVLDYPAKTVYGPVCAGTKCAYPVLPGALLTLRSTSGKVIRTARTGANGHGHILLPKGISKLTFSHTPYKGHRFGTKTYTIMAPVYMPPPTYFLFTFCLTTDC